MKVYILTHPDPSKDGPFGGVDFSRGKGSTSDRRDAFRHIQLGCTAVAREYGQTYAVRIWEEQDKASRQMLVKEDLTLLQTDEPKADHIEAGAVTTAAPVSLSPQEAAPETAKKAEPELKPKRPSAPRKKPAAQAKQ